MFVARNLWDFLRSSKTEIWKLFIARNSLKLLAIFDNRTLETVDCSKLLEISCELWKQNSLKAELTSGNCLLLWNSLKFLESFENKQTNFFIPVELLGCVYRGKSSSSVYKACRLPDQGSWALISVKFAAVK